MNIYGGKWEFLDEDFMNSPSILNKFLWWFFLDHNGHGEGNYPALGLRGIKLKKTKNGNFSSMMEVKFPVV